MLQTLTKPRYEPVPDDLTVLRNKTIFVDDRNLDHLWFELVEREAGGEYHLHRVVQLAMLRYLPQEARQEAGLLATMRTALTGLYNQRTCDYDPCCLVAGIFDPPLGVVQCYGAVGTGQDRQEARHNASLGMGAVEAMIANFPQSRLEPLNVEKADWIRQALLDMSHSLVVIGQPDPRLSARGMGREGPAEKPLTTGETSYNLQQNEMLFRAMAQAQEEFLFLVLASRLAQRDLAIMLEGAASEASAVASRQSGMKSIHIGIAFPVSASGQLGQSAGSAYGQSEGESASDGLSQSETESHTEGHTSTTGRAVTDSVSHTEGHATSSGGSTSTSTSVVEGTSHVDGQSRGEAHTQGVSEGWGTAHTQGSTSTFGGSTTHSNSTTHMPLVVGLGGGTSKSSHNNWSVDVGRPAATTSSPDHNDAALRGVMGAGEGGQGGEACYDCGGPPGDPTLAAIGDELGFQDPGQPGAPLDLTPGPNLDAQDYVQAMVDGDLTGDVTVGGGTESQGHATQVGSSISGNFGVPGAGVQVGGSHARSGSQSQSGPTSAGVRVPMGSTSTEAKGDPPLEDMDQAVQAAADGDYSQVPDGMSAGVGLSGGASESSSSQWSATLPHTVQSSSTSHSSHASVSHSAASSQSHNVGVSQAHSQSQGQSTADGVSRSVARTTSSSSFSSSTHSVADTVGHAETSSWSESDSVSDGVSHGVSRSHATGRSSATSIGRVMGLARAMGLGAGIVPSVAASKSYQWQDDNMIQLTQLLRGQEELLRQATVEGAFLADVYMLCRTERGAVVADAALRQAFHGQSADPPVVTPVQTRLLTPDEQEYIRLHAACFTPSTRQEPIAEALEAYKDTTMLLPLHLAAYMAPGLFEEGTAATTQERIPAFAFEPDMPGDLVLGHQWSTERGALTKAPLRLSQDRMFHCAFAADTGFGKTVAAQRLAMETSRLWKYRTIVLDFGLGWRRLLNSPLGEEGRVEVRQVFPGAAVPFRWNPFQIGPRINPERQLDAMCELIRNAGQMGPRQFGFMRDALEGMYIDNGVLTSYKQVLADANWNTVRGDEWDIVDQARAEWGQEPRSPEDGLHLSRLEGYERQALAVYRSRGVDIAAWYGRLEKKLEDLDPRSADHTSLRGVLTRLVPFTRGEMHRMYGRGSDTISIEDLGNLGPEDDSWGISILEGGQEMSDFAKAVIFSLAAWHLYQGAVVRQRQMIGRGPNQKLQIFFEEANKVLGGVAAEAGGQDGGKSQVSEIWQAMWRDGRKYDVWLHVIAQTVSELPEGILSSCNNACFSQTKNPKDRDLQMAHLAFSEKGFTDEDYKRFISRMAQKMAVVKLGYSDEIAHTTPFLVQPVWTPGEVPGDLEIFALSRLTRGY